MTSLRPPAAAGVPSPPPPSPPLALTIRFSASLPDLDLEIPHPAQTTVVSLKHLIRARLSEPTSQRRLRFIQGGRILPDGAALAAVLRAPPAPPPSTTSTTTTTTINYPDHQGKGKGVLNKPPPPQRIYVNCSIGDSLTTAELEDEARAAAAPAPAASSSSPLLSPAARGSHAGSHASSPGPGTPGGGGGGTTTTAAPRGFERLLNAGFTPAEVNQLRLQFRSIHSSRFTPDTLPSPDSFRRMEDSWIDDNGAAVPATALAGSSAPDGADDGSAGLAGHLDALVWGVLTGFMWPLGSFGWLVRQPGIHSDRWRIMVCFGVLFSFLFGIVRGISGAK